MTAKDRANVGILGSNNSIGLTIREAFAMVAMHAFIGDGWPMASDARTQLPKTCVIIADELLEALYPENP